MQFHLSQFGSGLSAVESLDVSSYSNDELTATTIYRMHTLASADTHHPFITDAALSIDSPSNAPHEVIHATFRWIKHHVRFVDDWRNVVGWWKKGLTEAMNSEVLVAPSRLISMPRPQGDCDDFAMLGMALLGRQRIESRFVTIKGNPYAADEWSHVYLTAWDGARDEWIPFDASHGKYAGWETEIAWERKVWTL